MNGELHWAHEIEHEARLQAIDHPDPLVPGERVAWSECDYGHTNGFSFVHRVKDELSTQCGQPIPAPIRRVPADLKRMLRSCLACVAAMRNAA
jgi:hypothetical protein